MAAGDTNVGSGPIYDGDVFFTVTTSEVENPDLSEIALGVLASELAWDAVLSCLTEIK